MISEAREGVARPCEDLECHAEKWDCLLGGEGKHRGYVSRERRGQLQIHCVVPLCPELTLAGGLLLGACFPRKWAC